MPINKQMLACTSSFQNNCAVNCLVHKIVARFDNIPDQAANSLHQAFLNYYGLQSSDLEIAKIIELLKAINNPVRLEIVLGPVLRNMLSNQDLHNNTSMISDEEICILANMFGVGVEYYADIYSHSSDLNYINYGYLYFNNQNLAATRNGVSIPILKFWRVSSPPHWEYEELNEHLLISHNQHYHETYRCIPKEYVYDAGIHKEHLKKFITENLKSINKNLNNTLAKFEEKIESGFNVDEMVSRKPSLNSMEEFSFLIRKLDDKKIAFFLSMWYADQTEDKVEILKALNNEVKKNPKSTCESSMFEAVAELASEGSKIGVLKNSKATTNRITIPQDANPQDIKNAKKIIAQLQQGGGEFTARALASNSKVSYVEGAEALAFDVRVGTESSNSRPSITPAYNLRRNPSLQELTQKPVLDEMAGTLERPLRGTLDIRSSVSATAFSGQAQTVINPTAIGLLQGNIHAPGAHFHLPPPKPKEYPLQKQIEVRQPVSWGPNAGELPAQFHQFVGRKELLEKLRQRFGASSLSKDESETRQKKNLVLCAFKGLGGIGKTQLALEYIHHSNYALKVWFSAENVEQLKQEYIDFAKVLGYESSQSSFEARFRDVLENIKQCLQKGSDWLLVYDNVNSYAEIEFFLPAIGKGHIILTTRHQNWPSRFEKMDVTLMTEPESLQLMESIIERPIKEEEKQRAKELAKTLGYLPLALAYAGAYIREKSKTIGQYLELYQRYEQKMLLNKTLTTGIDHAPVAVTWDTTLDAIEAELKERHIPNLARILITVCAYLSPDNIPRNFLLTWIQKAYPELSDSEIVLDNLLAYLKQYSLINLDPQNVSIHRLLQTVLRYQHEYLQHSSKEFPVLTSRIPSNLLTFFS